MEKKIKVLLFIILLAGSYFVYKNYFINSNQFTPIESDRYGNSSGNISNAGYAVNYNGHLFGDINPNGQGLFKGNLKGKELLKLTDDQALYINAYKDWIYYINYSDNGFIYKVRTDGRERKKLIAREADSLNVYNGNLYFIDIKDNGKIYRVNSDGKDSTIISGDNGCLNLIIKDGYIYYSVNGNICRMDENGRNRRKITSIRSTEYDDSIYWRGNFDVYGIYLAYPGKDGSLYRIRTDGTDNMKLIGGDVESINIYRNNIYYFSNTAKTIYRVSLTGNVKPEYIFGGGDYFSINITDDSGVMFKEKGTANGGLFKILKNLSHKIE